VQEEDSDKGPVESKELAAMRPTPSPSLGHSHDFCRRDTPVIAAYARKARSVRATLTSLTGAQAGRLVAIEASPMILGRAADSDMVLEDPGVSRRHARLVRTAAGGFYIEDLRSTNGTFVNWGRVGLSLLQGGEVLHIGPHLRMRFAVVDAVEEALYRRLYESSIRDSLTQLFNREYLHDRLVVEIAHARRTDADLALLAIDIDSLKQVNDRFGHAVGDRALCSVADCMKRAVPPNDVLARYGGDEFLIVVTAVGGIEAAHLAERVRRSVEELDLAMGGQEVRLTLSIGIASLSELTAIEHPISALMALSDERLYRAKGAGRNCVSVVARS
jgi:two-component system cell cycle response regulator